MHTHWEKENIHAHQLALTHTEGQVQIFWQVCVQVFYTIQKSEATCKINSSKQTKADDD